jgi:hypothetical protein
VPYFVCGELPTFSLLRSFLKRLLQGHILDSHLWLSLLAFFHKVDIFPSF